MRWTTTRLGADRITPCRRGASPAAPRPPAVDVRHTACAMWGRHRDGRAAVWGRRGPPPNRPCLVPPPLPRPPITCASVRVPTASLTRRQLRPCCSKESRNLACSSGLHGSRGRGSARRHAAAGATASPPPPGSGMKDIGVRALCAHAKRGSGGGRRGRAARERESEAATKRGRGVCAGEDLDHPQKSAAIHQPRRRRPPGDAGARVGRLCRVRGWGKRGGWSGWWG